MPDRKFRQAHLRALSHLAGDDGALWGPVDPRWMFCAGDWWYLTNSVPGAEPMDGLWRVRTAGALTANTAVDFAGHRWAQISDVPDTDIGADVLLLHELFHAAIQERLGLPSPLPPAGPELSTVAGKALFLAEVRAWLSAAADPSSLPDAIAIREHRRRLTSEDEWERQRLLELGEGLAEYSGMAWARAPLSFLSGRLAAHQGASAVRAGAYWIGPGMGFALDASGVSWRREVGGDTDLGAFAQVRPSALGVALARVDHGGLLAELGKLDAKASVDRERRRLALAGPVLEVVIDGVVFDPRFVESSPLGTLYVEAGCTSEGSQIAASDGMVVSEDFSTAYLACPTRPAAGATNLAGPGWAASFDDGWETRCRWLARSGAERARGVRRWRP